MPGYKSGLSRRRFLQGASAMWLMSVSPVGLAAVAQVVAVRVWPSSTYTRVTVESNHVLKYRQFALSNPERLVVDLEGVNLNSVLKGMGTSIRDDDPYIKSARVGQFDPQTVRDVASFSDPKQPADGIEAVMVNGVMSYGSDKKITGRAGRFLRRRMS